MTPLHWQESAPERTGPSGIPSNPLGFIVGVLGGAVVSFLLVGLVVGYAARTWMSGAPALGNVQQIVQVPDAPAVPAQQPEPTSSDTLPEIDPKTDHIRGDFARAKIAVVEYSDFECPFCQRHHPTMQQVMDTYKDDIVWVYRHFPLSFHPNAQKAAEASECANELGGNNAFWQFTDGVFALDALSNDALAAVAKNIGLKETAFKQCLDSGTYAQHVKDDMDGGVKAGVQGTPGNIVVNLKTNENRIVSGAVPFSNFQTVIDGMLGSDKAAAAPPGDAAKTITMTAELWKFTPSVVTVKQGENVTLKITGVSGTHGLSIPGLGINETIIQGKTVSVNIPTNKTGTFDFACSVQCGSGHNDMKGKIVIES